MRIGIFDSGLGGLTAVRELELHNPNAGYVYFGDTARVPYGTKGKDVISRYAVQDSRFLLSKSVDAIVVACCTVSATCLPLLESTFRIPFFGVVEPAVRAAVKTASAKNGRIAVLGTSATIKSGAFEKGIKRLAPSISVTSIPCPLLVPLVENGHIAEDDRLSNIAVSEYVSSISKQKPDAVILGCTHYPLLAGIISKYLPDSELINCSAVTIAEVLAGNKIDDGKKEFYVSDDPSQFSTTAKMFLRREITDSIEQTDIEKL